MKWKSVALIWKRELRDQLRDRRTLFMIGILPLLLYPLLGMAFLQMLQFLKHAPLQIHVAGVQQLPESPVLFEFDLENAEESGSASRNFDLVAVDSTGWSEHADEKARPLLESGEADAVVYFPDDFGQRLDQFRRSIAESEDGSSLNSVPEIPQPIVFFNAAKDKSRIARERLASAFQDWRDRIAQETLQSRNLPALVTRPFEWQSNDLSKPVRRRAVVWSKILPFVALIWALTGAFYPAIDICAGEKERGTLETLLSSPAKRSEIVWGKMLTIMVFSVMTSLLNLCSMGITASFVANQFQSFNKADSFFVLGPPPWHALAWLALVLIPISAIFSATSLALATMARSTREGQYYLMPLMLVTMPLLVLPMFPSAELDLGTSLIPLTGVVLLLRSLIEGAYGQAALYFVPVTAVTAGCCLLAIRWAIDQFNNETVLFRESERVQLGRWLWHLVRDRRDTPSAAEAIMCGILLLVIRFFASLMIPAPQNWNQFAVATVVTLVAFFATPALLMTIILTRSPKKTLLLQGTSFFSVGAAFMLAVFLHPIGLALTELVHFLYPVSDALKSQMSSLTAGLSVWQLLPVLAFAPAVCEELAYRGFILSGLRQSSRDSTAIIISSVFFGVAHGVLQQSMMATLIGIVIGVVAVRTQSIIPCIIFHFTHNSLAICASIFMKPVAENLPYFYMHLGQTQLYGWHILLVSLIGTVWILRWFLVKKDPGMDSAIKPSPLETRPMSATVAR